MGEGKDDGNDGSECGGEGEFGYMSGEPYSEIK